MQTLSSQIALETRLLLFVLNKVVKKDFEKKLHQSGTQISGLQYGVLRILKYKTRTLSDLSHKMMVEAATLVPVVDSLEDKDYLKRVPDRMDRRKNLLSITQKGSEFLATVPMIPDDDKFTEAVTSLELSRQKEFLHLMRTLLTKVTGTSTLSDEIHDVASIEYSQQ